MSAMIRPDVWMMTQQGIIDRIVRDMTVLSGDIVGPSDQAWQDVAQGLAMNLATLAVEIQKVAKGTHVAAHSSHLTMLGDQFVEALEKIGGAL